MASRSRLPRLLVVILLLAAAGGGTWWYLRKGEETPPEIITAKVVRGDITQVVTSTGDLQPVTTVDVSSQISGLIREVLVDFNAVVKAGDVLARLDPATYESRLKQSEAELANSQANHQLVRVNAERIRSLREQGLVSQQELDQVNAQLAQADAQILIRNAAVANARTDLSRCTIYAPIDGIVIDRLAEVGKTVAASLNAPTLFTIANDLSQMQINAAVAEADIGQVEVGQRVQFTVDAFPNRQFRGRVSQIRNAPKTQQNVVTYATIIDVRNDDLKLKPGMTANVSVVIASREASLRIPNSALRVRVPESLLPPAPAPTQAGTAAAPAGAPSPASTPSGSSPGQGGDRRAQMRALMQEVGVDFRSGPPSPDQLARLRKLAEERGIELPERFAAPASSGAATAPVPRTVYVNRGTAEKPRIEAVAIKAGISDGITTEVVEGLAEGDDIITSIIATGASAGRPASNPFTGGGGFPRR